MIWDDVAVTAWMGVLGLLWAGGIARAVRSRRDPRFRVGPGDPRGNGDVRVSVVVPARNEAPNIGACVRAVLAQDHPSIEVVVVDDGSTDGTGEVLRGIADPRLVVVSRPDAPPPAGWLGKPNACRAGAEAATGSWLLFVDADVRLAPEAVSRTLRYAEEHALGLLSGLGTLENVTLGERLVMPVVTGAILAANKLEDVNDPAQRDKALASGQFLLFRRQAYDAIGGHEAVKGEVVDDVGLALAIKRAGLGFGLVHMRALYRCRMYQSGIEAWRGWRKNLFPGVHRNFGLVLGSLAFTGLGIGLPYLVLALALFGILPRWWAVPAALPIVGMQGLRWYLDGIFEQDRLFGQATHLLGNLLFPLLLVDSAWHTTRRSATWKGRKVG